MSVKDALDMALKHLDLASRLVQFFLIVIVAMGGWVVSSNLIATSAPFALGRVFWAAMFLLVGLIARYAVLNVARRTNACMQLAQSLADESLRADPAFIDIVQPYTPVVTRIILPAAVTVIAVLTLCWPGP